MFAERDAAKAQLVPVLRAKFVGNASFYDVVTEAFNAGWKARGLALNRLKHHP